MHYYWVVVLWLLTEISMSFLWKSDLKYFTIKIDTVYFPLSTKCYRFQLKHSCACLAHINVSQSKLCRALLPCTMFFFSIPHNKLPQS